MNMGIPGFFTVYAERSRLQGIDTFGLFKKRGEKMQKE
jgi:hypothetical protein